MMIILNLHNFLICKFHEHFGVEFAYIFGNSFKLENLSIIIINLLKSIF